MKRVVRAVRRVWTRPEAAADNEEQPEVAEVPAAPARKVISMGATMVSSPAFEDIRQRIVPMMEIVADKYRGRVPAGYPNVVDQPGRSTVGLEIEPNYAVYIVEEEGKIYADMYRRLPRNDNRSGGGRQKFGGSPFYDRRELAPGVNDQILRNLIAELMTNFNFQPGLIHITDD